MGDALLRMKERYISFCALPSDGRMALNFNAILIKQHLKRKKEAFHTLFQAVFKDGSSEDEKILPATTQSEPSRNAQRSLGAHNPQTSSISELLKKSQEPNSKVTLAAPNVNDQDADVKEMETIQGIKASVQACLDYEGGIQQLEKLQELKERQSKLAKKQKQEAKKKGKSASVSSSAAATPVVPDENENEVDQTAEEVSHEEDISSSSSSSSAAYGVSDEDEVDQTTATVEVSHEEAVASSSSSSVVVVPSETDITNKEIIFKAAVEAFTKKANSSTVVTLKEAEALVRQMGGTITTMESSNQRRISLKHVKTGERIIGYTWDPQGQPEEIYPFWRNMLLDTFESAIG